MTDKNKSNEMQDNISNSSSSDNIPPVTESSGSTLLLDDEGWDDPSNPKEASFPDDDYEPVITQEPYSHSSPSSSSSSTSTTSTSSSSSSTPLPLKEKKIEVASTDLEKKPDESDVEFIKRAGEYFDKKERLSGSTILSKGDTAEKARDRQRFIMEEYLRQFLLGTYKDQLARAIAESKAIAAGNERARQVAHAQAASFGFTVKKVHGDGDCLYHSISDQLAYHYGIHISGPKLRRIGVQYMLDNPADYADSLTAPTYFNLRHLSTEVLTRAKAEIKQNKDKYSPFMPSGKDMDYDIDEIFNYFRNVREGENEKSNRNRGLRLLLENIKLSAKEKIEAHARAMLYDRPLKYADDVGTQVISDALGLSIVIIQPDETNEFPIVYKSQGAQARKIFIVYENSNHYNSLTNYPEFNSSEEIALASHLKESSKQGPKWTTQQLNELGKKHIDQVADFFKGSLSGLMPSDEKKNTRIQPSISSSSPSSSSSSSSASASSGSTISPLPSSPETPSTSPLRQSIQSQPVLTSPIIDSKTTIEQSGSSGVMTLSQLDSQSSLSGYAASTESSTPVITSPPSTNSASDPRLSSSSLTSQDSLMDIGSEKITDNPLETLAQPPQHTKVKNPHNLSIDPKPVASGKAPRQSGAKQKQNQNKDSKTTIPILRETGEAKVILISGNFTGDLWHICGLMICHSKHKVLILEETGHLKTQTSTSLQPTVENQEAKQIGPCQARWMQDMLRFSLSQSAFDERVFILPTPNINAFYHHLIPFPPNVPLAKYIIKDSKNANGTRIIPEQAAQQDKELIKKIKNSFLPVGNSTDFLATGEGPNIVRQIRQAWIKWTTSSAATIKTFLFSLQNQELPTISSYAGYIVIWSRFSGKKGGAHPQHTTSYAELEELVALAQRNSLAVILAGDKGHVVESEDYTREEAEIHNAKCDAIGRGRILYDLREMWKLPSFKSAAKELGVPTRIFALNIFDYINHQMCVSAGTGITHIGWRSGNIDSYTLIGHRVFYFEEYGNRQRGRLESWHSLAKTDEYHILLKRDGIPQIDDMQPNRICLYLDGGQLGYAFLKQDRTTMVRHKINLCTTEKLDDDVETENVYLYEKNIAKSGKMIFYKFKGEKKPHTCPLQNTNISCIDEIINILKSDKRNLLLSAKAKAFIYNLLKLQEITESPCLELNTNRIILHVATTRTGAFVQYKILHATNTDKKTETIPWHGKPNPKRLKQNALYDSTLESVVRHKGFIPRDRRRVDKLMEHIAKYPVQRSIDKPYEWNAKTFHDAISPPSNPAQTSDEYKSFERSGENAANCGFDIIKMRSDGHDFFNAVSDQLHRRYQIKIPPITLRNICLYQMRQLPEEYDIDLTLSEDYTLDDLGDEPRFRILEHIRSNKNLYNALLPTGEGEKYEIEYECEFILKYLSEHANETDIYNALEKLLVTINLNPSEKVAAHITAMCRTKTVKYAHHTLHMQPLCDALGISMAVINRENQQIIDGYLQNPGAKRIYIVERGENHYDSLTDKPDENSILTRQWLDTELDKDQPTDEAAAEPFYKIIFFHNSNLNTLAEVETHVSKYSTAESTEEDEEEEEDDEEMEESKTYQSDYTESIDSPSMDSKSIPSLTLLKSKSAFFIRPIPSKDSFTSDSDLPTSTSYPDFTRPHSASYPRSPKHKDTTGTDSSARTIRSGSADLGRSPFMRHTIGLYNQTSPLSGRSFFAVSYSPKHSDMTSTTPTSSHSSSSSTSSSSSSASSSSGSSGSSNNSPPSSFGFD